MKVLQQLFISFLSYTQKTNYNLLYLYPLYKPEANTIRF